MVLTLKLQLLLDLGIHFVVFDIGLPCGCGSFCKSTINII